MSEPRNPRAGGIAIAAGALIGAFVGLRYGQASLGFVIGCAAGGAVALLTWIVDRGRRLR